MMTPANMVRRWWYWQKMARIDRHCAKYGHQDYGCWSEGGGIGDRCSHCKRILWTWWPGKRDDEGPRYQEPTRLAESNWR